MDLQGMLTAKLTALGMGSYAVSVSALVTGLIKLILILILAKIALSVGSAVIGRIFRHPRKEGYLIEEKRAQTLTRLLQSALFYLVAFMAAFEIFRAVFSWDASSLLAGAGIVGLAVGFGAQSLVKDVITGFFLIFENQFTVGELVMLDQAEGHVEEIGLRVTKIRALTGEMHFIPNGSILRVVNKSRGFQLATVEVGIAYEADIDQAVDVLNRVAVDMNEEYQEALLEEAKVLGVVRFGPSEMILRVIAKTKPMENLPFEREFRRRVKHAFDQAGIEIPYPRQVLISGSDGIGRGASLSREE